MQKSSFAIASATAANPGEFFMVAGADAGGPSLPVAVSPLRDNMVRFISAVAVLRASPRIGVSETDAISRPMRDNRPVGTRSESDMSTDNQVDGSGWGNVRFRPRRLGTPASGDDAAQARFVQGAILFVVVALAYPWYAYWVQSRLLAADANRALSAIEEEIRALPDAADIMTGEPAPTLPIQVRSATPRILGVSEGTALSVIVADLRGSSLDAATTRLCTEAARWTRRPIAGRTFRVQAYRRSEPATTVGTIRC